MDFFAGTRGQLFRVTHTPAQGPVRGKVLHCQALFEEQNKSRRMVALQSRHLAAQGWVVVQPDLYGCGDSDGDFEEARWAAWLEDLARCADDLEARYPGPLVLWGLRAGCLLLSDLTHVHGLSPALSILWQPVSRGDHYLNQFLRLRVAAAMMGQGRESTKDLRAQLKSGTSLEVAGYTLHPDWVSALANTHLQPPKGDGICWCEVTANDQKSLPPVSDRLIQAWQQSQLNVDVLRVTGEAFWNTQEIYEVPDLLKRTTERVKEVSGT
ncbi:hydrolase 2, exosortase A system-associated [Ectothiorhodospira variabilis]|nr:hydrolase 2, exosortase A system-associated [Ectothiorhodospira variabilis]MCG5504351.1 hydrolase 2, exosortase A system-associated [Ectothiorhodospira variabilis]MCG5507506.1 hydrolase 2, exosortase A system-associated [Ectothiorhodospira variabilis]